VRATSLLDLCGRRRRHRAIGAGREPRRRGTQRAGA